MSHPEDTPRDAAAALLRLIDYRINNAGCTPPFELADAAIRVIAQHALEVTKEHYAKQYALPSEDEHEA